ncbi:MAG: SIS domain-containing protein [Deltaproteobacteria bacterium]|nr:SIS domain-containing protein [Deltaproteobacteria bacterium]
MNSGRKNATLYTAMLNDLLLRTKVTNSDRTEIKLDSGVDNAVNAILDIYNSDKKTMVIGNGGSAAIASHMQNDLCKAVGVKSLVFNDQPLLTALANDNRYGSVFEYPINMWAQQNDLLIGISSSGESENILRGARTAKERGCRLITFSGFHMDNQLRKLGDINFYTPSSECGYVEVVHSALTHMITDMVINRKNEHRP